MQNEQSSALLGVIPITHATKLGISPSPPLTSTPQDRSRLRVGAHASAHPSRSPGASILDQEPRETTLLLPGAGTDCCCCCCCWGLILGAVALLCLLLDGLPGRPTAAAAGEASGS